MLDFNYNSPYKKYANQSIDWCPMDTEVLYQTNLKQNYDKLYSNGWINSNFKYTFNSDGFRCEEFTNEPSIMFLGCSNTLGIGLPINTVWTELVSKKLNLRCANLGIGGAASDTSFRLCHGWIDKINPILVIFLSPPGYRLELVNNHSIELLGLHTTEYKDFLKKWNQDNNNNYFNSLKNELAIKSLCNHRGIKYLHFKSNALQEIQSDFARDLAHTGPKTHQSFANHVINSIDAIK
jgi:hypothetical protein